MLSLNPRAFGRAIVEYIHGMGYTFGHGYVNASEKRGPPYLGDDTLYHGDVNPFSDQILNFPFFSYSQVSFFERATWTEVAPREINLKVIDHPPSSMRMNQIPCRERHTFSMYGSRFPLVLKTSSLHV